MNNVCIMNHILSVGKRWENSCFVFVSLKTLLHGIFLKTGPDCSLNVPSMESYWILPNVKPYSPSVGWASRKAVLHGKFVWVIGGYILTTVLFKWS